MKIQLHEEDKRKASVTEIPEIAADGTHIPLRTLGIEFQYIGNGQAIRGVTLDHAIIPQLVAGFPFGSLTEREKDAVYAALVYAAANIDDVNEAFEDDGSNSKILLQNRHAPRFLHSEIEDLVPLFTQPSSGLGNPGDILQAIENKLNSDGGGFTPETLERLGELPAETLTEILDRINAAQRSW